MIKFLDFQNNSPVEVEGGEPAVKLQSGGTDEDLVVFGDLTVPGRNKKFKSVVKDIAKEVLHSA